MPLKRPKIDCINCGDPIVMQHICAGHFDFSPSMPPRTMALGHCFGCDQYYAVFFVSGKVQAKYTIEARDTLYDRRLWPDRMSRGAS